jgi:hypothetical protein
MPKANILNQYLLVIDRYFQEKAKHYDYAQDLSQVFLS